MSSNNPGVDSRPLPVRWAWLLVLLGGVAAYLIVLRTLVTTQNPLYVPSLLLLGSAVGRPRCWSTPRPDGAVRRWAPG